VVFLTLLPFPSTFEHLTSKEALMSWLARTLNFEDESVLSKAAILFRRPTQHMGRGEDLLLGVKSIAE
jgi:hypothetical protein